jgi:hypothetical protein
VPCRRSWASVVSAPVGSLASANLQSALEKQSELLHEVVRPLHEVVDPLHGWMLAIGGFLERAEAMLGRLSRTSAILWFYLMLAKWAQAERAFMVVSLLVLVLAR